jgi:hypothetical protein
MGYHSCLPNTAMPMIRPKILIETARIGARLYQRERDLPGAIPGTIPGANSGLSLNAKSAWSIRARRQIVTRLSEAEWFCEEQRRGGSPAYRPGKHVQVLSALIAESDDRSDQTKASGSEALHLAI